MQAGFPFLCKSLLASLLVFQAWSNSDGTEGNEENEGFEPTPLGYS
jgi:hypothetical protein